MLVIPFCRVSTRKGNHMTRNKGWRAFGVAVSSTVILLATIEPASASTSGIHGAPTGGVRHATEVSSRVPATNTEQGASTRPLGGVVVYWGVSETGKYFETIPLDGSNPANRGIARPDLQLPLNAEARGVITPAKNGSSVQSDRAQTSTAAASPAAGGGLYCERYVSDTTYGASNSLYADVDQRCSGSFVNHWVSAKFERSSWSGWRDYTVWANSSSTSQPRMVWTFSIGCGAGGTYDYRLNTRGYARSTDGTTVSGGEVYGGSYRRGCGT